MLIPLGLEYTRPTERKTERMRGGHVNIDLGNILTFTRMGSLFKVRHHTAAQEASTQRARDHAGVPHPGNGPEEALARTDY